MTMDKLDEISHKRKQAHQKLVKLTNDSYVIFMGTRNFTERFAGSRIYPRSHGAIAQRLHELVGADVRRLHLFRPGGAEPPYVGSYEITRFKAAPAAADTPATAGGEWPDASPRPGR